MLLVCCTQLSAGRALDTRGTASMQHSWWLARSRLPTAADAGTGWVALMSCCRSTVAGSSGC